MYVEDGGTAYTNAGAGGIEVNIIGDGSGGKAIRFNL